MVTGKVEIAAVIVSLLLYLCLLTGVGMIAGNELYLLLKRFGVRHRLKKLPSGKRNKVFVYLENLASSALKKEIKGERAALAEAAVFGITFLLASRSFSFAAAAITALLTALMPPAALLVKLQSERGKGSREGISFVSELSRQYRIRNKNIYEALSRCCENGETYPVCARQAYKLLMHLRGASGREEIRSCTDRFAFALGTVWGRMLAGCIRIGAEKGTDISAGLADIVEQLEKANKRAEERRRLNSESVRMTVFLVPAMYVITLLLSGRYLDMSVKEMLHNQFFTPEGLMFMIVIVFLFFVNLLCISLVSNTGSDL